jgi:ribosomal protein S18 acetylase RimI-like enzyme
MTGIQGIVRRASPEDLDHVLQLDLIAPVGHERAALLTSRVQSGEVIVFEDNEPLGFAVVRKRSFFGRDFLELLTVAESTRRQGVGSQLLNAAVAQSTTDRIFTSTNQSNTGMIGLLEKTGWQLSGQLEGIDEGDPELIYFRDAT